MTHDEIKLKLFALYDGPLTEKERVMVEVHLSGCKECRQAVGEWENLSGFIFPSPAFSEASEDFFVSQVMNRVSSLAREKTPAAPQPWNILQWLVPLAGSAIAAAWVFFSVLPGTPGFASNSSVESLFSNNTAETSSPWASSQTSSPSIELASFITGE